MKQIEKKAAKSPLCSPSEIRHCPSLYPNAVSVSIEVKVTVKPVCDCCGYTKEHVAVTTPRGVTFMLWVCPNSECPSHTPTGGAAAQTVIDVEPIRRAA